MNKISKKVSFEKNNILCKNEIHGCTNYANKEYRFHHEYSGYCSLCRRSEMYPEALPENLDINLRADYELNQKKILEENYVNNLKNNPYNYK